MENARIDRAAFKDHAEIAAGSSATVFTGTSYAVNIENYQAYELTLNADCSFTFANATGSGNTCSFTMILKQDQVGGWEVAWPTGMRWQGGIPPKLATAPGDFDVLTFFTHNGGGNWVGAQAARNHLSGVGELWAWGNGAGGVLAQISNVNSRSSPVQIGGFTNWKEITTTTQNSFGIKVDGTLWAWGTNTNGFLGDSTVVAKSSPVQIGALANWGKLGRNRPAAIKTDGTLWCWGSNTNGQIGDNTVVSKSSPVQIGALTDWKQVSGSNAIKTDGTLWAWGSSTLVPDNTNILRSSPTQIGSATNWKMVSCGGAHALAIKTDGTLWAWGSNAYGQLGDSTKTNRSSPTQIGNATNWAHVSASHSQEHSLAVRTDGTLWAWGQNQRSATDNGRGKLGTGNDTNRSSPVQVGLKNTWVGVSAGTDFSLGIQQDGTLWGWGTGVDGRLGVNNSTNFSSPVQIGTRGNWRSMDAGGSEHVAAFRFPPST